MPDVWDAGVIKMIAETGCLVNSDKKHEFAEALLYDPRNPYKVAKKICNGNLSDALYMAINWADDKEVIDIQNGILAETSQEQFLPSKYDVARDIHDHTRNNDPDVSLRALKLYSDVMGFIEKPGVNINNNVQINDKVMVIPDHGDDDSWEDKLKNQQKNLIESSG